MIALPGTQSGRAQLKAVGFLRGIPMLREDGAGVLPSPGAQLDARADSVIQRASLRQLEPLLWIVGTLSLRLMAVGKDGEADVLVELPPGPKVERLSKSDLPDGF